MSNTGTKEPSLGPGDGQSPAEPQRRGRGRPRKPPQDPIGPPVPKRPRGRPKGSKNKGPRVLLKGPSEETMAGPSEPPPSQVPAAEEVQ
ncbi:hypothetical protein CRUP_024160 [Coryphaenoides rupestris]|nr:hypothetical protein CRUP_024160 [Coryphaenoides rupestris]